ncbi:MAG: class I SAM-dependent methyltransferase [Planctomycetes bacterium]|nr:class I SAM-dependent methyltransferase [Planctomycetota bacterium]
MNVSRSSLPWWPRPFGTEYADFRKWGWILRQVIRTVGLLDLASRLRWRMLAQQIGRRRFERVLDAGCGTGVFAFQLVRTGRAARVDGIDVRREVVEEASRIAREKGLDQLRFRVSNLDTWRLPWNQPPYDLIICVEALTYVRDRPDTMFRLREALAPDGLLYLSLPHDKRLDNPRHFTIEETKAMLRATGFEVVSASYVIGRYHGALIATFDFLTRHLRPLAVLVLPILILLASGKRFPVPHGQFVMALARPARCADKHDQEANR